MSKKDVRNLVIFVVFLAIVSNLIWLIVRQPKITITATATATATAVPTATSTTVPTMIRTPFPTFVPTLEPTPIPAPLGDWKLLNEFGGGPVVTIKSDCYVTDLNDCVGDSVQIYLEGHQFNDVFLNGFDNHNQSWSVRLVPGHNQLTIPVAEHIGIGNKTDITVKKSNSTGYYLSCSPDSSGEGCVCTQFDDATTIYQSPIADGMYLTTIEFWSEYSDTFFLNDMVEKKSIPIESGTVLVLSKYNHETWDITVLPFFGERPTPMPTRTPTVQP